MKFFSRSLQGKLLTATLAVVLVILTLWGSLMIKNERQFFLEQTARRAKTISRHFALSNIEAMLSRDYPVVQTNVAMLGEQDSELLQIRVTQEGREIAHYQSEGSRESLGEIPSDLRSYRMTILDSITYQGNTLGEVEVIFSTREAEERVQQRIYSLAATIGLVFVVLSGLLVLLLRKMILRPISHIARFARAVGQGELNSKIPATSPVTSEDEIGDLAHAMNQMVDGLKLSQQRQLEKELLEKEIQIRKESEAELIQAEKLSTIGLLAAGFAHEINNPAYALSMNLSALEEILPESDQMKHHVKRLQQETERIKKIIKTFLNYSQKNRSGLTTQNLFEGVESVLLLLRKNIEESGTTVHWESIKSSPPFEADHGAVNQVLTNLIQNSLQAGAKNITLEAVSQNSHYTLKVRDDGSGIDPEILPKIFEPFFTTKEVGKGTGLGLNIVQRIIRAHLGEISVKSEIEKGTEFEITLPLQQPLTKD